MQSVEGSKVQSVGFLLGEVVDWGMVLGAVVAQVVGARFPDVPELALSISATDPVKPHVH